MFLFNWGQRKIPQKEAGTEDVPPFLSKGIQPDIDAPDSAELRTEAESNVSDSGSGGSS